MATLMQSTKWHAGECKCLLFPIISERVPYTCACNIANTLFEQYSRHTYTFEHTT